MSRRIITFTDAPEDYDGFGTKTLKVLGQRRGKTVRVVETPEEHAQWQRDRYASGLYFAFDRKMWDEYKFEGELEGIKIEDIEVDDPGGIERSTGIPYGADGYAIVNGMEVAWMFDWVDDNWKFFVQGSLTPEEKKALEEAVERRLEEN